MKKLLLSTLLLLPSVCMADEPDIMTLEKNRQYHLTEARRLDMEASSLTAESKDLPSHVVPANRFLDTKFPHSSAAPGNVKSVAAMRQEEARGLTAQAEDHRQMAAKIDAEVSTIRAQMAPAKAPARRIAK
jgi:hypothetical protein